MVCCQRGRRGDVWEKGWEKEGDVQNTYCLESNVPLCRVNALLGTLLYVSVLVFFQKYYFCQNNIQTDTIMENNYYETPQLEVLEIAVEQGFATSTVDYEEGWKL